MDKKLLYVILATIMVSLLIPVTSVHGAGLPNPDHIIYATHGGIETVDPAWAYDTASGEIIQNIYEPLCAFDGESTEAFVAKLADWWPGYGVNPGNVITPSPPDPGAPAGTHETWYFRIRTGVKFHNGATLTTADVEYSFERGMLMDHSGGPQWMLYEPLLGVMGSSDYDVNENGEIDESEYVQLENDIKRAIECNETHVWFNLKSAYAPFQQILSQTWGCIINKAYAIAHGCWNGQYGNYTEFLRCYDPPTPGPLMTGGVWAMGTGPYKLKAINTDPHVGWYTLEKFDLYWGGWPAPGAEGFATYATVKLVEEWFNRKVQFFSTDPNVQVDFCVVPRANVRELHENGNKDGPTYPGFRLFKVPRQAVDAIFFNYNVTQPSDYTPKLGTTPKPDLFMDRNMRLVFIYAMNITKFIQEYWLGEAIQPTTCMPPGTAFYNESKAIYQASIEKAQAALDAAWGGQAKAQGISVKLTYNSGNTARETECRMIKEFLETKLTWGSGATLNIEVVGVPWSVYLPLLYGGKLGAFTLGWLADFPDPHNWFMPFMHSHGDYSGYGQHVTYGLGDINANWPPGPSYGPLPYTNALGDYVSAINNTYIDNVIEVALGQPPAVREALYNELMDIYYAEASALPTITGIGRHYERTWIHGWKGTWNSNPISPGYYFYTIWKELEQEPIDVEVGVSAVEFSPVSNITNWILGLPDVVPKYPYMKKNPTSGSTAPLASAKVNVARTDIREGNPPILVYVSWAGWTNKTPAHGEEFAFDVDIILGPTPENPAPQEAEFGPGNIADVMPAVGQYEFWVKVFVLSEFAFNVHVSPDFDSGGFYAVGYCDVASDKVNIDNRVTIADYQLVKKAAGSVPGGAKWNYWADVNCSNSVTIADVVAVKGKVGAVYTPS